MNVRLCFPFRIFCGNSFSILVFTFYFFLISCAGSRGRTNLVQPIDESRLKKLLTQAQGKAVLLNFWATWCDPCVEEFPDLIKLARDFRPHGLEVILVSLDELEDLNSKIVPFLGKHGVNFRTYFKKTRDDEVFINTIDAKWSGAIPATFIYDTQGNLAKRFVAQQSFDTLIEAVRPLLPK